MCAFCYYYNEHSLNAIIATIGHSFHEVFFEKHKPTSIAFFVLVKTSKRFAVQSNGDDVKSAP